MAIGSGLNHGQTGDGRDANAAEPGQFRRYIALASKEPELRARQTAADLKGKRRAKAQTWGFMGPEADRATYFFK